jgi:hypothetical protein
LTTINNWEIKKLIFQLCSGGNWLTVTVNPGENNIKIIDSINRATKSKSLSKIPEAVKPVIALLTDEDK